MEIVFEERFCVFARVWLGALLLLIAWGCLQAPKPDDVVWFYGADKLIHLSTYALLYISAWAAFPGDLFSWLLHSSLLAYGLLIEGLQHLTGYRSAEFADMLANATGLGLGCLLLSLVAARMAIIRQYGTAFNRMKL